MSLVVESIFTSNTCCGIRIESATGQEQVSTDLATVESPIDTNRSKHHVHRQVMHGEVVYQSRARRVELAGYTSMRTTGALALTLEAIDCPADQRSPNSPHKKIETDSVRYGDSLFSGYQSVRNYLPIYRLYKSSNPTGDVCCILSQTIGYSRYLRIGDCGTLE
jgi:hypothetical protein